jgi:thiamine-phosphate pyrophosphorylase
VISDEVIGFSTHNKAQLKRANEEPVEYLSLGPIFPTKSKLRPDPVVGLETLSELRKLTPKPLVAIGGITLDNALDTLATEVDSLAVISGCVPDRADRKSIRRQAERWLEWLQ